jgi:hypothetical protein
MSPTTRPAIAGAALFARGMATVPMRSRDPAASDAAVSAAAARSSAGVAVERLRIQPSLPGGRTHPLDW